MTCRDGGGSSAAWLERTRWRSSSCKVRAAETNIAALICASSWVAAEIENYLVWLVEHDSSVKSIWRRGPIAFAFGEFARARRDEHHRRIACARRGTRGPVSPR